MITQRYLFQEYQYSGTATPGTAFLVKSYQSTIPKLGPQNAQTSTALSKLPLFKPLAAVSFANRRAKSWTSLGENGNYPWLACIICFICKWCDEFP